MCHLKPRPHRSLEECQQLLKERLPGIEKWAAEVCRKTEEAHRKAAHSKLFFG